MSAPLQQPLNLQTLACRATLGQRTTVVLPRVEWKNLVMYVALLEACLEGYVQGGIGVAMRQEAGQMNVSVTLPGFNLGRGTSLEAIRPRTMEQQQVFRILQRTTPPGLALKAVCIIHIPNLAPMHGGYKLLASDAGRSCITKWQATYMEVQTMLGETEQETDELVPWKVMPINLRRTCAVIIRNHLDLSKKGE